MLCTLSFILLLTVYLSVNCSSKCAFDTNTFRLWCRTRDGVTIFRIQHTKRDNGTWLVEYMPSNESCSPHDVMNVLPPPWIQGGVTPTGPVIINDPCNNTQIRDPEEVKEMIDKGYEEIGHSLYKLHAYGASWDYARLTCMEEKAHLAIINSKYEATNLAIFFRNQSSTIKNAFSTDGAFIGFHDIFQEGEYLTVEGVPLADSGYNIWMEKKPDNNGILKLGEPGADCGGFNQSGEFTDLNCDFSYAFICEYDLRVYSSSNIDYTKGRFVGKEGDKELPEGTKNRTKPGVGYKYYPGIGFYRYHTTPVVWENARLWCEREGAYLAIIDSLEESELLRNIVKSIPREFIFGDYEKFAVYTGRPRESSGTVEGEPIITNMCRSSETDLDVDVTHCQVKHTFICEKSLYE